MYTITGNTNPCKYLAGSTTETVRKAKKQIYAYAHVFFLNLLTLLSPSFRTRSRDKHKTFRDHYYLWLDEVSYLNIKIHLPPPPPPPPPNTHSNTSRLNCFCRFPRNSPIICLLRPFLCRRKWATPTGVSGTKPRSIRYWTPFSGFLRRNENAKLNFLPLDLKASDAKLYNFANHF